MKILNHIVRQYKCLIVFFVIEWMCFPSVNILKSQLLMLLLWGYWVMRWGYWVMLLKHGIRGLAKKCWRNPFPFGPCRTHLEDTLLVRKWALEVLHLLGLWTWISRPPELCKHMLVVWATQKVAFLFCQLNWTDNFIVLAFDPSLPDFTTS